MTAVHPLHDKLPHVVTSSAWYACGCETGPGKADLVKRGGLPCASWKDGDSSAETWRGVAVAWLMSKSSESLLSCRPNPDVPPAQVYV